MPPLKSSLTRALRSKISTRHPGPFSEAGHALAGTTRNVTSAGITSKLSSPSNFTLEGKFNFRNSSICPRRDSHIPSPDFRSQTSLPPVNHASGKLNSQQAPFDALLNNLTHHLTSTPISGRSPQIPYLHSLLRSYKSNPSHWSKYAHANPEKQYTRNLVCEVPGVFNLLLLVWTPGKKSPVHDHADAHCLMKVYCHCFGWMRRS